MDHCEVATHTTTIPGPSSLAISNVPERPNQPMYFKFPQRQFGKKKIVKRSFQSQWFKKWQWLHYDEAQDLVFCHVCATARETGKMTNTGNADMAFIERGFSNWKDASGEKGAFSCHQQSNCHKRAVELMVTLPWTTKDVGELLSLTHSQEKLANRQYLLKVTQNIRFLARQGIALRGDGDEHDSNFVQLLHLRSINDPSIHQYMQKKTDKYCSHQIQNELLEVMANKINREIADQIRQAKYFAVMADEVIDASNREQVVVCMRWVNDELQPHEDFLGLYKVDNIQSNTIVGILNDILLRMNLTLSNCCGQCYDGASNMAGSRSGVSTQLSSEEPRAVYTHCYGHALNLAVGDVMKKSRLMGDTLNTTSEISKLLKYSPRRDATFEKLKAELAPNLPGFRTLCPTRWTVKGESMESVVNNYIVFQNLWEEVKDITNDSEIRARIVGVQAQMEKFEFLFGLVLGIRILKHTDNLSKTLQSPELTATDGQKLANLTCQTLEKIRNDECFDLFWDRVILLQKEFEVNDPILPRKRKAPRRYESGSEGHFHESPKDLFRQEYFSVLDLIIGYVKDRFHQRGYGVYKQLEDLLLKAIRGEQYQSEFDFVTKFYGDDFNPSLLPVHFDLFNACLKESDTELRTLVQIRDYFIQLSPGVRSSMSEIATLLKILMVMPATNAVNERSASALRRVKTYLRTTSTQKRLNNLMTLHIHKNHTDALSLESCINDFVTGSEHRLTLFGSFS